jgi:nicotinate-nucleotide pyrophosphorylase (carboxylating)
MDFHTFFDKERGAFLQRLIRLALEEDGRDLTSLALFGEKSTTEAFIVAKQDAVLAGLPVADLVFDALNARDSVALVHEHRDGTTVRSKEVVLRMTGPAAVLLTAERVIMNFVCHLSGIATMTRAFADRLIGTRSVLLDTRKTTPGLRYPEKYAVLMGGGQNHRMNLEEMLMLKDNHIDRAGSITRAVAALRLAYDPCPPIEVECRTLDHVREAVACGVDRIMFDNMDPKTIGLALPLVPESIETEASGNVTLQTIRDIGLVGPDFISSGYITHSAPTADFSMRIGKITS